MRSTVQDVMTRDVVVAHPTTSFKQLIRLLAEHRIAALPVVDAAGLPVGVVSETDLTARQTTEDLVDAGSSAADVMTTPAVTIHPETPVVEAARRLQDRKVRRLLVVDVGGALAGIVTRTDLLKVFLRPDDYIRFEIIDQVASRMPQVIPQGLQVEVTDGRVILGGEVERHEQAVVLRGIAGAVDGVVEVQDHLNIRFVELPDQKVPLD
jgi:CBS domain-containing protein